MSYYFGSVIFCAINYFIYVAATSPNLNDVIFNGENEFIDMTYPFDKNTIYWPDMVNFMFTSKNQAFGKDGSWYAANNFAAGEHGGTHIDAPYHFDVNGIRVGEIPLDKLIVPYAPPQLDIGLLKGPPQHTVLGRLHLTAPSDPLEIINRRLDSLIIADVSSKVNDDPNFVLYKHHLDYLLNDNMGKPCVIIFKFGWSKYFSDRKKYLGSEKNDTLNFPGLSGEVAEWIVSSYKNVVGIGVDTASVDPGSSTDFPVHKVTSSAGLFNMENVKLDIPVPEFGCTALILPMKIARGTGAPLRLVAICPKQLPNLKNELK